MFYSILSNSECAFLRARQSDFFRNSSTSLSSIYSVNVASPRAHLTTEWLQPITLIRVLAIIWRQIRSENWAQSGLFCTRKRYNSLKKYTSARCKFWDVHQLNVRSPSTLCTLLPLATMQRASQKGGGEGVHVHQPTTTNAISKKRFTRFC